MTRSSLIQCPHQQAHCSDLVGSLLSLTPMQFKKAGNLMLQAANLLRKSHGIRVTGGQAPPPLTTFADLGSRYQCSKRLMAKLEEHGWHEPTAIQRQAIPALLERRELFAVAPTGQSLVELPMQ